MANKSPFDELIDKISRTKIDADIKVILKLLVTILTTVQNDKDTSLASLNNRVVSLESKNKSLEEKVVSLNAELADSISSMERRVQSLEEKLERVDATHTAEVLSLRTNIDTNEQYERKDTLIISGPDLPVASQNENSKLVVKNLLNEKTRVNIDINDISIAHRIGRKPNNAPDKRGIIFKLCRRDLVQRIFTACRQSRPPFYVNCSLTPTRNKVFYALRQLKRKFPAILQGCRAQNGDVVAFLAHLDPSSSSSQESTGIHQGTRKRIINSRDQLIKFASEVLKTNLDDLNVNW